MPPLRGSRPAMPDVTAARRRSACGPPAMLILHPPAGEANRTCGMTYLNSDSGTAKKSKNVHMISDEMINVRIITGVPFLNHSPGVMR